MDNGSSNYKGINSNLNGMNSMESNLRSQLPSKISGYDPNKKYDSLSDIETIRTIPTNINGLNNMQIPQNALAFPPYNAVNNPRNSQINNQYYKNAAYNPGQNINIQGYKYPPYQYQYKH